MVEGIVIQIFDVSLLVKDHGSEKSMFWTHTFLPTGTSLHCQLALPEGIPKTSEPWLVGWVPLFHLIKVINNPI
jgi:hypothetical protein